MTEIMVPVTIEPLDEGGFLVTSADLPALLAEGDTIAEALDIARDVAQQLVESYRAHGEPLPEALASGGA